MPGDFINWLQNGGFLSLNRPHRRITIFTEMVHLVQ